MVWYVKETLIGYLLRIIIILSVSHLYGKDQEEVIQFNIIIMHLNHASLSFMVQNLMLCFVQPEFGGHQISLGRSLYSRNLLGF